MGSVNMGKEEKAVEKDCDEAIERADEDVRIAHANFRDMWSRLFMMPERSPLADNELVALCEVKMGIEGIVKTRCELGAKALKDGNLKDWLWHGNVAQGLGEALAIVEARAGMGLAEDV